MIIEANRELKEYFKEIRSLLPVSHAKKQEIMEMFESSLGEFLEHNPGATVGEIKKHFGSPEMIAEEYLAAIDDVEIHNNVKRKKRFWYLVATSALVLFLISAALIIIFYCGKAGDIPKYYVVRENTNNLSDVSDEVWNDGISIYNSSQ